jgi:hypothetical protein
LTEWLKVFFNNRLIFCFQDQHQGMGTIEDGIPMDLNAKPIGLGRAQMLQEHCPHLGVLRRAVIGRMLVTHKIE